MKIVNKTGYLKGAKTAKNPVNIIPSNLITTQGMAFPIKANGKTLYPNTGQYKFPTSHVVETPLKQKFQKGTSKLGSNIETIKKLYTKAKPYIKSGITKTKNAFSDATNLIKNTLRVKKPVASVTNINAPTPFEDFNVADYMASMRNRRNNPSTQNILLTDKKNKVGEKLSKLNKSAGKWVDTKFNKTQIDLNKVINEANSNLKKGVGIKKSNVNIELKRQPYSKDKVEVFVDGNRTGNISLENIHSPRSLTDIITGKKSDYTFGNVRNPGLKKVSDYPFGNLNSPVSYETLYKKTGISGEINKSISEATKNQKGFLYSGGTGHTSKGRERYENLLQKGAVDYLGLGADIYKYKKNGTKGVSLAFSRGEKDPKGGLTQKGVDKYNRATGGNLKMAVTTPPSKLKAGSKAANRRKSFCARMSGVKGPMAKNGKPTRKALALRKWNC